MIDVSVSVPPRQARTLWLDLRDRILTPDSLWLSIASAAPGFDADALDGAQVRLVFAACRRAEGARGRPLQPGPRQLGLPGGRAHHVQAPAPVRARVRGPERPAAGGSDHELGRLYWNYISYNSQGRPPYTAPAVPRGVPAWAFNQVQDLAQVRQFVDWWIDERQVAYGDFGGGISDDSDLTQQWPGWP